jgi:acetylglutamate kinase
MSIRVIKVGGKELDQQGFPSKLASALQVLGGPIVVIHGGGRGVDVLQRRLGLETVKVRGMRYTDEDTLEAVMMTLCGVVSSKLVAGLVTGGVDAVGLSGVDGATIRCRKLQWPEGDLGLVGEIFHVRAELLLSLLERGITPVLAPLSLGPGGQIYNVNADHVATAVAQALEACCLDFVSDVPSVRAQGKPMPELTAEEARSLISRGEVRDGMVPKIEAALKALDSGIPRVRICDLTGLNGADGTELIRKGSGEVLARPRERRQQ